MAHSFVMRAALAARPQSPVGHGRCALYSIFELSWLVPVGGANLNVLCLRKSARCAGNSSCDALVTGSGVP
jgi:hypothetical protein